MATEQYTVFGEHQTLVALSPRVRIFNQLYNLFDERTEYQMRDRISLGETPTA